MVGVCIVEFMRETEASCDERPQFHLAVAQHVQKAELKVVDIGTKDFRVRMRSNVPPAETCAVSRPHKLRLRVLRQRITQERPKTCPAISAQPVEIRRSVYGAVDRVRTASLKAYKRRYLPLLVIVPLRSCGGCSGQHE